MGWLYSFFHAFSICLFGTSAAFLFVAKYVHRPLRDEETEEPFPFEWRYLEELEALAPRELSDAELRQLYEKEVDVETPEGRVVMTYDVDTRTFVYYTVTKTVPFKYLDAIARQFAVENDAKQICVNYGHDYVTNAPPKEETKRESVFVKFKSASKKNEPKRTKIANRFSHRGSIEQKWTVVDEPNRLTFAEYKKKMGE